MNAYATATVEARVADDHSDDASPTVLRLLEDALLDLPAAGFQVYEPDSGFLRLSRTASDGVPDEPFEARLTSVRRFVTEAAEQAGLSPARIFDLTLAASEACANAIEHGQGDDWLCVGIRREPSALRVEITSPGSFDINVSHRREPYDRGLGLPLMVALTDEVTFARLKDGGTKVCLTVML